jgi:hypothetical protein
MGKNTKPMLTVLVEGDKLQQFRDYALSKEVSMGWVVNRLLDRVLSGELDVMGDSPSTEKARGYVENTSTGLTREDVEIMIKSSILNLNIASIDSSAIEELTRVSIEIALEPIKQSVSELETYTRSQFAAVRDEIKRAISDRSVTTESIAVPITPKIAPNQTKIEDEPEWVNKDNRRFYLKLVGNSELIAKATEEIERHPNDNKSLAECLVKVGIHKQDGTAFDSASMSRIKGVVKNLNTPQPI